MFRSPVGGISSLNLLRLWGQQWHQRDHGISAFATSINIAFFPSFQIISSYHLDFFPFSVKMSLFAPPGIRTPKSSWLKFVHSSPHNGVALPKSQKILCGGTTALSSELVITDPKVVHVPWSKDFPAKCSTNRHQRCQNATECTVIFVSEEKLRKQRRQKRYGYRGRYFRKRRWARGSTPGSGVICGISTHTSAPHQRRSQDHRVCISNTGSSYSGTNWVLFGSIFWEFCTGFFTWYWHTAREYFWFKEGVTRFQALGDSYSEKYAKKPEILQNMKFLGKCTLLQTYSKCCWRVSK